MMSIYLKDNIPQSSTRLNVVNEIAKIIVIIINTVFKRRQYVVYVVDTLAQTSDDN